MTKRITVKVHPKAKFTKIVQDSETAFTVWTPAVPDKGEANAAVIKILSDHLRIAKSKLTIKQGSATRNKVIEIME